ncbi:GNAT family N-acetyltransferase [Stieleria varia]|uniref:BioF2-like acetyltransferase domain-containing protein n=1 Tax=Stieleria varia TaxID=2528005 RepID=A0A5C6ASI2_9BACT|nr:GNAT family N-acetyltransferase [Stieleria varia]TWU02488.1 hypothetical protein Pla52n_35380 [Stieleria varia]
MSLTTELISDSSQLDKATIDCWNSLAANPLQRWEWLGSWWHAYQGQHTLYVLLVKRGDEIVGIAPWCMENRISTGRTVVFLGSGKACTDHLSLLCRPGDIEPVCNALAQWLNETALGESIKMPRELTWDAIELIGGDESDERLNVFANQIERTGLTVKRTAGDGCYVIDLPEQWEQYVAQRSKSGRRELRQSIKNVDDGTVVIHTVQNEAELEQYWDDFVDLHQRRRHASGTTGCFDHPPFDQFIRRAASEMLKSGMLRMAVAIHDDTPIAAMFAITDAESLYFYQSGMNPDEAKLRPGSTLFCEGIRNSINEGRVRFDMMRGDESYKLRWRAQLHPSQEIRICSPRASAQIRNQVYSIGISFKNLIKSGLATFQPSGELP